VPSSSCPGLFGRCDNAWCDRSIGQIQPHYQHQAFVGRTCKECGHLQAAATNFCNSKLPYQSQLVAQPWYTVGVQQHPHARVMNMLPSLPAYVLDDGEKARLDCKVRVGGKRQCEWKEVMGFSVFYAVGSGTGLTLERRPPIHGSTTWAWVA
jgi:hypothetical protein